MEYIVIYFSERGTASLEKINRTELLQKLNDQWWGNIEIMRSLPSTSKEPDLSNKLFILSGEIVVPQAMSVVTEYSIN